MCSSKTQIHASGCGPKIRFDKCSVPKQPARHQDLRNPKTLWEDVYVARWVPCCWTSCMWCWKRWINWPPPLSPGGGAKCTSRRKCFFLSLFLFYFVSCLVVLEARSRKLEAGSRKTEAAIRSQKPEDGSRSLKPEAGSQKPEGGPKAGSRTGSQKPEAGVIIRTKNKERGARNKEQGTLAPGSAPAAVLLSFLWSLSSSVSSA